jgi:hypothetical protein
VAAARKFVAQQQANKASAAAVAEAWPVFCTAEASGLGVNDSSICNQVGESIQSSYNSNVGRRAGMLCTLVKVCTADMGPGCLLSTTLGNATTNLEINQCTVEVRQ